MGCHCHAGDGGTAVSDYPPPSVETVTVTAPPDAENRPGAPATSPPSSDRRTEPAQSTCSQDAVPVTAHAGEIEPPFPGETWIVEQAGNLCGPLGYAALATLGGTGSSPTQLLLYNEGEFLGTGVRCGLVGEVTGSTAESVTVTYRWPVGDESNAQMSGRAEVTFYWNGSSVDMIGDLPREATLGRC